jgi:threonine synthase
MGSFVTHLECPRCDLRYDHTKPQNVCECGSPLLVEYDLDAIKAHADKDEIAARVPTMWRYSEFLPVDDPEEIVSLGEGFTPLLEVEGLGIEHLYVKDEGANPTGSFKARGASCGVTRARELGARHVALPTAGNAGGAWAAYGAAAGIRVHVAMPKDAPEINKLECRLAGADLDLVDGLISDAGALIARGVESHGWFDASTLKEPYRIEGKKTLGLEIAEQLGWEMPDAIVYPAGGGVGLIGIWRALIQLREIGWVEGNLPRLVVVQARGCAPIVRAFDDDRDDVEMWEGAHTIAAGLRVPKPLGGMLTLRALRHTRGTAVGVSDESIRRGMATLASCGILACPEGAATLIAAQRLRQMGWLRREHRVVLINTGTALKYPDVIATA